MKQSMDEKKNCENCRHFSRHYAKSNGGTYNPINCGHCICSDMDKTIAKRTFQRRLECVKWEPREIQIQERREEIKSILEIMERHLHEIVMALKDDRDYLEGKQDLLQ